jgi:hypothetical protein
MSRLLFTSVIATLGIVSLAPASNVTPVIAKTRTLRYEVRGDGKEVLVSEAHGTYLRSSSGKSLRVERPVVDGVEQQVGQTGEYRDPAQGKVYRLLYDSKKAVLTLDNLTPGPPLTAERLQSAREHAVGTSVINGVSCLGFPIKSGTKRISVTGVGWMSMEYDLPMKIDQTETIPGSGTFHLIKEFYEVQLGSEPPVGELAIPSDFTLTDKSAGWCCSAARQHN